MNVDGTAWAMVWGYIAKKRWRGRKVNKKVSVIKRSTTEILLINLYCNPDFFYLISSSLSSRDLFWTFSFSAASSFSISKMKASSHKLRGWRRELPTSYASLAARAQLFMRVWWGMPFLLQFLTIPFCRVIQRPEVDFCPGWSQQLSNVCFHAYLRAIRVLSEVDLGMVQVREEEKRGAEGADVMQAWTMLMMTDVVAGCSLLAGTKWKMVIALWREYPWGTWISINLIQYYST